MVKPFQMQFDGAAADERVLRVPVDRLEVEIPAHLLAHGLGQLQVEAGELPIIAHVAVGRVALVEAHRQRERPVRRAGVAALLLRVAAAGAPGQHHRGQRQRGHGGRERYEFLLHRLSHRPEPGRRAPFPHDAFASTAFLLYCTKARGQYSTAVEKRNPLRSGTGDGRRKRSEREPAAAPKRKRDDGHHIEAAPR